MKMKFIRLLEQELSNKNLQYHDFIKLLKDPKVLEKLDTIFSDKESISILELTSMSSNENVIELFEDYLLQKGIPVVERKAYVTGRKTNETDSMSLFFREISKYDLLTKEEEQDLFFKYNNLPDGEEKDSIRGKIINSNLRLVAHIANKQKYKASGLDLGELVQEGCLGLMKSVDKFDYTLGYKFSTYATWWIRQAIDRAVKDKARVVRIPVHAGEQLNKIHQIIHQYYAETGEHLSLDSETIEAIAKEVNTTPDNVLLLLNQDRIYSLDKPIYTDEDSDRTALDYVSDGRSGEDEVLQDINRREIREFFENSGLSDREKDIIRLRYGFDTYTPMTLDAIAKEYGVTRERIRQIQNKAEKKLKARALKKNLLP